MKNITIAVILLCVSLFAQSSSRAPVIEANRNLGDKALVSFRASESSSARVRHWSAILVSTSAYISAITSAGSEGTWKNDQLSSKKVFIQACNELHILKTVAASDALKMLEEEKVTDKSIRLAVFEATSAFSALGFELGENK